VSLGSASKVFGSYIRHRLERARSAIAHILGKRGTGDTGPAGRGPLLALVRD
jgi:hypothetical protein